MKRQKYFLLIKPFRGHYMYKENKKKREGQKRHGEELLKQKWPGKDTARTSSTNYQRTKRGGKNCTYPMIHKEVMKACQASQKNCLHNYTKPRLQGKNDSHQENNDILRILFDMFRSISLL